jgi:hypothetical protein
MIQEINKQRLNSALLTVAIIFFVVATLALIKLLFSNSKGFEWGTVSDLFSALCNLATAVAAVYAAFNAKRWLSPKIQNEGFRQANQVLLDMIQINIINQKMMAALKIMLLKYSNGRYEKYSDEKDNDRDKYHNQFRELNELLISFGNRYLALQIWKIDSLQDDQFIVLICKLGEIQKLYDSILYALKQNKNANNLIVKLENKCNEVFVEGKSISEKIEKLSIPFDLLFK